MMSYLSDEAREKLDTFKAVMVKHARLRDVDQELALAIEEHADAAHLLFYGSTGVGKSTVLGRTWRRSGTGQNGFSAIPVVFIEARTSDTGTYVRMDYYRQVLLQLKGHILVKELLVDVGHILAAPSPTRVRQDNLDWLDVRDAVETALIGLQVKAVIIDEAPHLMEGDGRHPPLAQLNWLKSMSNRTNVLHILAGSYDLFNFRNLSGQAARRGRDIHFERYHVDDKQDRAEFVGALEYLLERIPLEVDVPTMLQRWRWFAEGSVGCVGILKTWLVDAVAATFQDSQTALSLATLERKMLPASQRLRLEMDARAGEHAVRMHSAESDRQLQSLWDRGNNLPNRQSEAGSPDDGQRLPQTPQVTPKPATFHVGERGLGRDPVGEASATQPRRVGEGCSFVGLIELLPAQMQDAAITRIECPVCFAVRNIQPKGDYVRFPKHPQRTTSTSNRGWRWVKRSTTWELAD